MQLVPLRQPVEAVYLLDEYVGSPLAAVVSPCSKASIQTWRDVSGTPAAKMLASGVAIAWASVPDVAGGPRPVWATVWSPGRPGSVEAVVPGCGSGSDDMTGSTVAGSGFSVVGSSAVAGWVNGCPGVGDGDAAGVGFSVTAGAWEASVGSGGDDGSPDVRTTFAAAATGAARGAHPPRTTARAAATARMPVLRRALDGALRCLRAFECSNSVQDSP